MGPLTRLFLFINNRGLRAGVIALSLISSFPLTAVAFKSSGRAPAASSNASVRAEVVPNSTNSAGKDEMNAICARPEQRRRVELSATGDAGDGSYVMLCGREAFLVKSRQIIKRLSIHITWDGNADKMPVHPAIKHMDFGARDISTFQVDSAGDGLKSKVCAQIITVYQKHLLSGPGFCRTADSPVRQITPRTKDGDHELLVTTIESAAEAAAAKVKRSGQVKTPAAPVAKAAGDGPVQMITDEIWTWHRTECACDPAKRLRKNRNMRKRRSL